MIKRLLKLPERSFFLFGPRGVGKSTWLKEVLPRAAYFDLPSSSLYLELSREPDRLEAMVGNLPSDGWVVIDEVHRLMETREWRFALCGSSARKLRRGGTNLLGGRAVTRNLEGFCSQELGSQLDSAFCIEWGCLPIGEFLRELHQGNVF
jgi:predicted AAA+ superfamily ATPase